MLHQILRVDAPNVWHSLLAFNVGVEIGQLMIVLLFGHWFCFYASNRAVSGSGLVVQWHYAPQ